MQHISDVYAVYWLRLANSAFLLARKCNWMAERMLSIMRNVTCADTQSSIEWPCCSFPILRWFSSMTLFRVTEWTCVISESRCECASCQPNSMFLGFCVLHQWQLLCTQLEIKKVIKKNRHSAITPRRPGEEWLQLQYPTQNEGCNCRQKDKCPRNGNCLSKGIVYCH